jgi:hypothetical protein
MCALKIRWFCSEIPMDLLILVWNSFNYYFHYLICNISFSFSFNMSCIICFVFGFWQCFSFFYFLTEPWWQALAGRFYNWRHYFMELLKCGARLPKKQFYVTFRRNVFPKKKATKHSVFRELCCIWRFFCPNPFLQMHLLTRM